MPGTTVRRSSLAVAGPLVLGLAACTSTPPPDDAMAQAQLALQRAEASQAPSVEPVALAAARRKLTDARVAMEQEAYAEARRLALEAAADAEYAEARADAATARQSEQAVDEAIGAIREGAEIGGTTP